MPKKIRILVKENKQKKNTNINLQELRKEVELDEGVIRDLWSWTKGQVAKLGSLEKGGKILGRSKREKRAQELVDKMLDKKANEFIRKTMKN